MGTTVAAPTQEAERLWTLDVLRGFALCGILLMNITVMGDTLMQFRPATPVDWANVNWRVFGVGEVLVEGAMRGLFSLLFGAGVVLITARAMRPDGPVEVADVFYRRAFMLMALGVMQFTLLAWPGEVLFIYGFASLYLFPLRKLGPKSLAVLAAACIVVNIGLDSGAMLKDLKDYRAGAAAAAKQSAGKTLTAAETRLLEVRKDADGAPPPEALKAEVKARSGDYPGVIAWSTKMWGFFVQKGWHGVLLDVSAFMLAGMALFKWGVLTGRRSLGFYVGLMAAGYGLGVPFNVWQLQTQVAANFSPEAWAADITYDIPRLLMTLGHLGLVLTLTKLNVLGIVGRGLANMGRMALTNYVGQSVIAAVIFYGFHQWKTLDWGELWLLTAAVWIVQAVVSAWWLKAFTMGPLEWLLRAVAYGRFTEVRRAALRAARPEALAA